MPVSPDSTGTRTCRSPLAPDAGVSAGPFCCAPSRADLIVQFTAWRSTEADASLHPED